MYRYFQLCVRHCIYSLVCKNNLRCRMVLPSFGKDWHLCLPGAWGTNNTESPTSILRTEWLETQLSSSGSPLTPRMYSPFWVPAQRERVHPLVSLELQSMSLSLTRLSKELFSFLDSQLTPPEWANATLTFLGLSRGKEIYCCLVSSLMTSRKF